METVQNSKASVADMLALDCLPEGAKALIARVYGDLGAPGMYTEDDLRDAYAAGWDDCAEQIEAPWMGNADEHYLKTLRKGKAS